MSRHDEPPVGLEPRLTPTLALAAAVRAAAERPTSDLDNSERDLDALEHWRRLHHAIEQGPRTSWSMCPGAHEHEDLADAIEKVTQVDYLATVVVLLDELAAADDVRAALAATAGEYRDYLTHLLATSAATVTASPGSRQAGR